MPLLRSLGVLLPITRTSVPLPSAAVLACILAAPLFCTAPACAAEKHPAPAAATASPAAALPDAPSPQPGIYLQAATAQSPTQTPSQASSQTPSPAASQQPSAPAATPASPQSDQQSLSAHDQAERDVKAQEKQRVLGVLPQFNATDNPDAPPLSAGQKFDLAWHSATDPVTFGVAAIDAGISQAENDFPGYGQGAQGYFKRFGAAYADSFDSTIIGNAALPALLHQDPRYFRLGHGPFSHRLWYAALSTVRCKGDNGRWQFNTSNVAGNFIAGGISNIYYPASDRGAGLTFERASTVTAEGALGALFIEFWPDVRNHLHRHHDPNYSVSPMSGPDQMPSAEQRKP